MPDELDPEFEALLTLLQEERGFDFTGYKRASLTRRVRRRMQQIGIETVSDYIDHLRVSPDEYTLLFNTLLINVTSFFRDTEPWEQLQQELLPELLDGRDEHSPIRVWSAGCASGEEAYTLVMVLAETLGIPAYRERVKIYATDIDEEALAQARQATYTDRDLASVPSGLIERYFEQQGARFVFRKDLRRTVIFGRNDIVQDAPISHVDLLTCRNTLMYLNAETQARVLRRFHFALKPNGLMLLGKAEMLLSRAGDAFVPVDLQRRFFRRVSRPSRDRPLLVAPALPGQPNGRHEARDLALHAGPMPQIVLDQDRRLLFANERAETMFGLLDRDLGRPFQDLELSYRPIELRSLLDQVETHRRVVWANDVEWLRSGVQLTLDVEVKPLLDTGSLVGTSIVFHDVSRYRRLQDELELSNRQLEAAYEELQSTNEELETTNEELQSTVEELETTNEELQSTNEELETMNEELQSTNDEFQSINDELRERSDELDTTNAFIQSVLSSLRSAVVVVDRDLRVLVWNRPAEQLWGLRQEEVVGEHLLALDFGLPVEQLRPVLRVVLGTGTDEERVLAAVDRRGRQLSVRTSISPLTTAGSRTGAVLVLAPEVERTEQAG